MSRSAAFSSFTIARIMLGASALLAGIAFATPQTVGDEPCPKYAVDIASFATCEGDRVVKPANDELPLPALTPGKNERDPLPPSEIAMRQNLLSRAHHGLLASSSAHAKKTSAAAALTGDRMCFMMSHDRSWRDCSLHSAIRTGQAYE